MSTVRVPVDGGALAVTVTGHGRPLLFLHGDGYDRHSWDATIRLLADRYHCVAPDRRGSGDSAAPPADDWAVLASDVAAVAGSAGAIGGPAPVIVGHSWGAKIGLVYAAAGHPAAGVFCVDTVAFGPGGTLQEDVYDRISCPVAAVFGTEGERQHESWPYTPSTVAAFSARHPGIAVHWLPAGHDIPGTFPEELAVLVDRFAAGCMLVQ